MYESGPRVAPQASSVNFDPSSYYQSSVITIFSFCLHQPYAAMESVKSDDIGAVAHLSPDHPRSLSRKLANPLAGLSPTQLSVLADDFCAERDIADESDVRAFRLGAQIAGSDSGWESVEGLTDMERRALWREQRNKWSNPRMLYLVVFSMFSRKRGVSSSNTHI